MVLNHCGSLLHMANAIDATAGIDRNISTPNRLETRYKMPQRPEVVGPETPEPPYPYIVRTKITSGFGRGSSELGIPTANIPPGELSQLEPGVYYGWSKVSKPRESVDPKVEHVGERKIEFTYGTELNPEDLEVFPMVMSIGWNPYYQNKEKSAEVHILHKFHELFYGADIAVVVAGFIRHEQSYDSLDALVADINFDMEVARNSLKRPEYLKLKENLA